MYAIRSYYDYGIGVGGNGVSCFGNIVSQNYINLIVMADNATINSNTISSTSNEYEYGIGLYSISENATFSENTVNNNEIGIYSYCENCRVTNNRVYSNDMYGIGLQGENVTISDNIVRDSAQLGILCYGDNSRNNFV